MRIETPASHANDPQSSFEFEAHMNKSGKRQRNQDIVYGLLLVYPESTAEELKSHCNLDVVEVRRRLSDMRGIRVERRSELRKCSISGQRVSVWYPL